MDGTEKWWALCSQRSQYQNVTTRDMSRFQLENFTQAVVTTLFSPNGPAELPDTFYLDQERLQVLKSEMDDLIHFEICFDVFAQCLEEFGYNGPVTTATEDQLRAALSSIVGDGIAHPPQSWMYRSEALSLEIYRQALLLYTRPFTCDHHKIQRANQLLQEGFRSLSSSSIHSTKIRDIILAKTLAYTNRHRNATPIELFNKLVSVVPATGPLAQTLSPPPQTTDTFPPSSDRVHDLANRVTHIVLLHWRVWGPIAYVQEDGAASNTSSLALPSLFHTTCQTSVSGVSARQSSSSPSSSVATLAEDTEMSELPDVEGCGDGCDGTGM